VLKIVYTISTRIFKNLNFLNKKLLFLLIKSSNADLSPNIKKS
jgi:hypothetical protein